MALPAEENRSVTQAQDRSFRLPVSAFRKRHVMERDLKNILRGASLPEGQKLPGLAPSDVHQGERPSNYW